MKRLRFALVAALGAVALVGAGCGGDDDEAGDTTETTGTVDTGPETVPGETGAIEAGTPLKGTVGPGFTITLTTEGGESVTAAQAGSYELELEDLSSAHNFHLSGPGVDLSTDVGEQGTQNVSVDFAAGTYTFVCDPHASQMSGSLEVS